MALRAGKANAMNARLLDGLLGALDELGDASAVVITGEGSSFSAGLALPELVELDRPAMHDLIGLFERAMQRILALPIATVAAINGHAYAGGCVLALMCDVRMMAAGTARIGLNEIALGIGLPSLVIEPLRARLPASQHAAVALEGRLFSPDEAVRAQLVDETHAPESLVAKAIEHAALLGRAPVAYAQIKDALLRPVLAAIARDQAATREAWLDSWFSPHARVTLRAAVERMTKR